MIWYVTLSPGLNGPDSTAVFDIEKAAAFAARSDPEGHGRRHQRDHGESRQPTPLLPHA